MVVDTMRAGATGKDKWQAKSLRSTFGNQCMSQLPTSPSCGFGSAVREATDRVRARWALPYVPAQFFCYHVHCTVLLLPAASQDLHFSLQATFEVCVLLWLCRHMCHQMWTEQTADQGEATTLKEPSTKCRSVDLLTPGSYIIC